MEPIFSERMRVVPVTAEGALLAILVPTDAFILISAALGWVTWWLFAAMAAVTAFMFLLSRLFILKTDVYDDRVVIKYFKTRNYRMEKIRDRRYGVMNDIRNFAGVGLRGLRYRNYLCAGCETGVVFLTQGSVVAVSSYRAEELAGLLPKAVPKPKEEE
ncbi:MAG: hypothetical protein PHV81_03740 [Candidatus Methanomethylophilaceae archaeon]|jgi:hypothetical protein|nr:hypothetical protein [Candidatus Methanomethylophilaceae archaeon]MDD3987234.1 hypothetical protein [Candidatus Methanomethylophilaceae archaeon]MDD4708649.1 hypothetical protein [Candidatus Methanomethylophilaceae archaeon]MDY0251705.1 hypothetical protein [Candidatus Methanomethylophilaceae archaeon]NCA73880.1 hypothetical protein [Gammaproteobacteria bacterium]